MCSGTLQSILLSGVKAGMKARPESNPECAHCSCPLTVHGNFMMKARSVGPSTGAGDPIRHCLGCEDCPGFQPWR